MADIGHRDPGHELTVAGKGKGVEFTVDQQDMQRVAKAMRAEEDGKTLRKQLVGELKDAVSPGVSKVQGKLRSIPHLGPTRSSPPMGSYLASRVKPQIRLSGRSTGVAVRIAQTPALRGFKLAARRLNRSSWRRRVFGGVWVTQTSPIPGFFDDTLAEGKEQYRAGVLRALEKMARRVARSA
ncbi:MAG TPA: hypothetical protein VFG87_28045 [Amycolatopsis sp.]|nr:hypothetical protein [Amycolatopsis sp.]